MEKPKKYYFDIKWIFILGIIGFLAVFQLFPLLYLLGRSVFPEGHFSLEGVRRIYSVAQNWTSLKNTLVTAGAAMIFGVLLAFPLAWLVGRTNLCFKKFFRTLFVMTYMVPPYVGAMAWLRLLNPRVGTLNIWLRNTLSLAQNPFNIYTIGGLVWVLTTFYYPYAFITISRAMEKMDPSLEEASRISGASPLKTLFGVTLPLMMPSIISSALLVFVSAASCYGIPSIIGAPGNIYTVTTAIVDYVSIGSQEGLTDATNLAVFLMGLALMILFVSNYVVGKRDYITVSGKSTRPNIVDLGKWRWPVTGIVAIFALIVVIIPFVSVFMTSFTVNMGKPLFATGNFTLRNWHRILSNNTIVTSLKNSTLFAIGAASFGMVVCLIMAYLLKRTTVKGKEIPDFLITVGSGTPSVVIALALIMTMSGKFGINIYNTFLIMIIAYMIKYMLMGMRTVVSAFSQISPSLEEAAQISGSGWLRRLRDVLFPLIAPSIVAGWFLIFMPCFYELTMSNLLYSSKTKTLGVSLYLFQTQTSQQTASAMAAGILLAVIVANVALDKLTKGKFSV
ncbi:MAG: iron ABC transporter permease [Fusobacteriaceae bacterium]|nr:iron ABC transporter permease [Fusobacteriaceae bacterium]